MLPCSPGLLNTFPDTGDMVESLSTWVYNYFLFCCHPDLLFHPSDTTALLVARYYVYQNLVARQQNTTTRKAALVICQLHSLADCKYTGVSLFTGQDWTTGMEYWTGLLE